MFDNPKNAANDSAGVAREQRRRDPRYSFSAAAEAVNLEADTRLSGRISDLRCGGCYLDTLNPFPVGAGVKIDESPWLRDNGGVPIEAKL